MGLDGNSTRGPRAGRTGRVLLATVCLAAGLAACGKDAKKIIAPGPTVVPDFSLTDVNPNSATAGQSVSPRQHIGQVSAWYFGHAT